VSCTQIKKFTASVRTLFLPVGGPYAGTETFPIAWGDSGLEAIRRGVIGTPKGADRTAQGNALGSTERSNKIISALKGRQKSRVTHDFCRPFRAGEIDSLFRLETQGVALGFHVRPLQGQINPSRIASEIARRVIVFQRRISHGPSHEDRTLE
jgi:hypothetical protein